MLVYGKQIVLHLLERHRQNITEILLAKEIEKSTFEKISRSGIKVARVDALKAQSLSRGRNNQGFFAKIEGFGYEDAKSLKKCDSLAVLCGLTDVGNIGAITRSAYCLGVEGIIIGGVKSLPFEEIARSSSGAAFEMPLALCENIPDMINELKMERFTLYGATSGGKEIKNVEIKTKKALFLGSEDRGLTKKIEQKMDFLVSIKMEKDFNSLNVSTAAAILFDRMR